MRRLRLRAGVYTSALMMLCGLSLAARATETITRSQAQAMIDGRLAAAGVLVFGAFWVLLLTISGRSEKALSASILRLEAAVERFTNDLMAHNGSEFAHTAAAEHNHKKMDERMAAIKAELDEHVEFCLTHQCAFGSRQPTDSPYHRRKEDPEGFDATKLELRGKKK